MAVPSNGPYWIVLAGRGTGQTATLHYQPAKPVVQNTYMSTDVLGPYSSLSAATSELKKLTINGSVTVVNANSQVLGSVNVSTGSTNNQAAPGGSSEPSNPTQAIQLEGGNVAPSISIPGLTQLGDFFGALDSKNTWIRVAKVIIGGTLLVVGLSHLTGADNSVANAARNIKILPV